MMNDDDVHDFDGEDDDDDDVHDVEGGDDDDVDNSNRYLILKHDP